MKRWLLIAVAAFATVGFGALGVWQIERRAWKLALIERVEQRVHAAPLAAPGPGEWPQITRENAEYRRVTATGRFVPGRETLVRAVTELGEGYWLMEPLQTDRGFTVLINRGFVPSDWRAGHAVSSGDTNATDVGPPAGDARRAAGPHDAEAQPTAGNPSASTTVTGLLRISEPKGAFLRTNAPAEHRWYSRDVEAISRAQHLTGVAPYFIDAEAAPNTAPESTPPPVAGLTVVHFRNSHLQYVITWFILALMALALGVRVARTR
jgi:surfeit locus 1 family protein